MLDDFLDDDLVATCLMWLFAWPGYLVLGGLQMLRGEAAPIPKISAALISVAFWSACALVFYFFVLGSDWRSS